ncbi:MAG: hypothetical protein V9G19_06910 [Tetrasphaera sp.]
MLARQTVHQLNERRAAMTAALSRAIGEVALELPGLSDDSVAGTRATCQASAVLTVVRRAARVGAIDPAVTTAAAELRAALAGDGDPVEAALLSSTTWIPPVDVLHSQRADLIAFTEALVRATKAGCCLPRLPRPVPQLLDDAEAALGAALAAGDHELTARLLATWPLLGAPWTAPARCALDELLVAASLGELAPGLETTLSVALVMALALEHGGVPEPWAATDTDRRVGEHLASLHTSDTHTSDIEVGPAPSSAADTPPSVGPPVRDSALVVAAALRAAALDGDRPRLRAVLALAVACGVSADAAIAATLAELCGLGAFTALAG